MQPPIETPSLILRPLVSGDAGKLFQMSVEEGMRTWLPSQVYRDEAHAASVLEFLISQYCVPGDPRMGLYVLGTQLRNTGELVGHVGLSPLGEAVEIGFAIETSRQRKGLATEAVRAMCRWASQEFALETILGITAARNVASQGVLLSAGFTAWKDGVMNFQGVDQPVRFFAFSMERPTVPEPPPDA